MIKGATGKWWPAKAISRDKLVICPHTEWMLVAWASGCLVCRPKAQGGNLALLGCLDTCQLRTSVSGRDNSGWRGWHTLCNRLPRSMLQRCINILESEMLFLFVGGGGGGMCVNGAAKLQNYAEPNSYDAHTSLPLHYQCWLRNEGAFFYVNS